jgi:hypothetical protein
MVKNIDLVFLSALFKRHKFADTGLLVVGWLYAQK